MKTNAQMNIVRKDMSPIVINLSKVEPVKTETCVGKFSQHVIVARIRLKV
jgi:hypothetical protein